MQENVFMEAILEICEKDSRYDPEAYLFVREALDFTVGMLKRPRKSRQRHVSGQELLEGLRVYALQEFGPMALTVLDHWGIRSTEDFGEIVFNLVEAGKLGKTEEDKKEDFADGYDFHNAFAMPFVPTESMPRQIVTRAKRSRSSAAQE